MILCQLTYKRVPPEWQLWSEWNTCSTENTCGRGVMHRYRNCSNGGVPGKDRFCLGFTNETAPCNGIKCRGRFTLFTVGGVLFKRGLR